MFFNIQYFISVYICVIVNYIARDVIFSSIWLMLSKLEHFAF